MLKTLYSINSPKQAQSRYTNLLIESVKAWLPTLRFDILYLEKRALILKPVFRYILALTALLPLCLSAQPGNSTQTKQTHLSCAIISSEHLTALQLFQRGLPKEVAIDALPNISRQGRKRVDYVYHLAKRIGTLNAYADINTNFARCSTLVHQAKGTPARDLAEYGYYFCSGENKLRFEIILMIDQGLSEATLRSEIPSSHHKTLTSYQQLIAQDGNLAAFDLTANNLKACLQQIE